ncbi:hypothetical protein ASPCAL14008 [Aspergillus calidoustus]|uniref:Uncharacterized protein n=1 Tax=Aspergillus calidoustus TaxID=454130 RepID=A0A0U4ZN66_ASPCI|nr:hypothetical protein ASPCAL14008 [Aspergillus calidoustus]
MQSKYPPQSKPEPLSDEERHAFRNYSRHTRRRDVAGQRRSRSPDCSFSEPNFEDFAPFARDEVAERGINRPAAMGGPMKERLMENARIQLADEACIDRKDS